MGKLRIGSRVLEKVYPERTRELLDAVRSLPARPSPDAIHDLRVAARRVQELRRLLPQEARRGDSAKKFDQALKSILRTTSHLRDLDTLESTLEQHKASLPPELFQSLDNGRSDAAAHVSMSLEALSPNLVLPEVPEVSSKKLSRKLRRRARKHGRTVSALLDEVARDEGKVEELHAMRKEVKKLRYLLELAEKKPSELPLLTKWQDWLGAIHDLDVAMGFVKASRLEFAKDRSLRELGRERHSSYLKFVSEYKAGRQRTLRPGVILMPGSLV